MGRRAGLRNALGGFGPVVGVECVRSDPKSLFRPKLPSLSLGEEEGEVSSGGKYASNPLASSGIGPACPEAGVHIVPGRPGLGGLGPLHCLVHSAAFLMTACLRRVHSSGLVRAGSPLSPNDLSHTLSRRKTGSWIS